MVRRVDNCVKAGFEPEGEEIQEKNGLYANIHAKRKRGGKMRDKKVGKIIAMSKKNLKTSNNYCKERRRKYQRKETRDPVDSSEKRGQGH